MGVGVGVRRGEPGKKECGLGVGAAEVKRGLALAQGRVRPAFWPHLLYSCSVPSY